MGLEGNVSTSYRTKESWFSENVIKLCVWYLKLGEILGPLNTLGKNLSNYCEWHKAKH